MQRFGARLRELREASDMTQEDVAFAAGLDRSYLSGIERGKKNLSLVNIHRIAKALDFEAPHIATIPSCAIFVVVLAANLLGDALRDVLDPRLQQ